MLKKKTPKSETKRRKLRRRKNPTKRRMTYTRRERTRWERGGAPPNCDGDSMLESWESWERQRDWERAKAWERRRESLGFFSKKISGPKEVYLYEPEPNPKLKIIRSSDLKSDPNTLKPAQNPSGWVRWVGSLINPTCC